MNNTGFTLIEIIIGITLFSIFIAMGMGAFSSSLSSIQYIKTYGEEQESMLYDDFMMDEIISNPLEIIEFTTMTNTGYLFRLDKEKHYHSYATLDIIENKDQNNNLYYNIGIKKMIPLNDIAFNGTYVVFTAPGENDIKNIKTGNSILSNTGILNNPTGLLYNGSDLYVSDTGNACIRKIDGTNNVSDCIIGKEAKPGIDSESLISPTYMSMHGNTMYISDTYNNKIRKVDITNTGNIINAFGNGVFGSDLSGTGTNLTLSLPTGLAIDGTDLYVADTGNNRILKINTDTGSGEVFVGTGEDKTIWISSGGAKTPNMIPISHPTNLKISGDRLYFTESISGVVKSVLLTSPYTVFNEFGSYKNIAYFGDFEEDLASHGSYNATSGINNFASGSIVKSSEVIPYSGNAGYKLIGANTNTGSFIYNFSGTTLNPAQNIQTSFYLKNIGNNLDEFNIRYGYSNNNIFIGNNYNTGIVSDSWNKYFIVSDFDSTQNINGFHFEIYSGSTIQDKEFLLDKLEINVENIHITGNTANKFENNFDYIGAIYIDGDESYVSSLFEGKNYKFDVDRLGFNVGSHLYNFEGIGNTNNRYLFDDYRGNTKLGSIDFTDQIMLGDGRRVIGLRLEFFTYNSYFQEKYIGVNK